jgi:hypothetical protein
MQRNTLTNSYGCSKLRRNIDIQVISELTNLQASQRHIKEDENMKINCGWEETTVSYLKYWYMPAENRRNNGPQDFYNHVTVHRNRFLFK